MPAPYGKSALAIQLDVTNADARLRSVDAALDRFGRIDVLANVAGRGSLGAAEEFSPEQLREQMEVNFFAVAEMTRAVLPAMRAQRSGRILPDAAHAGHCASVSPPARIAAAFDVPISSPVHLPLAAGAIRLRRDDRGGGERRSAAASPLGAREEKQADFSAELARWRAIGEATAIDGARAAPIGGS